MKRKLFVLLITIYLIYFIGLLFKNDTVGDILSPLLTLISGCIVLYGYGIRENTKIYRIAGIIYSIGIFSWFFMDFMWGVSTLLLHVNPEENLIIFYGYFLTNILILVTFLLYGFNELKNWNKMQFLIDAIIITFLVIFMLWVFVFEQDMGRALLLWPNKIPMISMIIDVIIFTCVSIWFLSNKIAKASLFIKLATTGNVIFAVTDFIYFYQFSYDSYEPNTLLDGGYILAFGVMALGAYVKMKTKTESEIVLPSIKIIDKFNKKMIIFLFPVVLLLFIGDDTSFIILVILIIWFYFVFSNYIQSNIDRDALLIREHKHVNDLEKKVEERTNELIKIMNNDYLTGLFNRRYFETYLEQVCTNLKKDECVQLLYIDLNKYSSIKSMYSKHTAESLLREVGNRMKTIVEEAGGMLASYGEDTYVTVLKGAYTSEQGMKLAQRILENCSDIYFTQKHSIKVTLSVGIACYPVDSKTTDDLVNNADMAMVQARTLGINRISRCNEQIANHIHYLNRIEMRLKKVVFEEEFTLHYQPQVLCKEGSLIGFEALIRWYPDHNTCISPLEFIPIAEEIGLIIPLGYWIMETAAKQLAFIRSQQVYDIRISINVSAKQLQDQDFLIKLKEVIQKYKIPPLTFEIEITENIQIEKNSNMLSLLHEIRNMGVSIAVDDFGTGYSSLYYLKNLPVDRIKIAKELIDNIENDIYSYSIIQMVLSVAKVKGIKVIAEGVETKEQWECLKKLGCDEIQGYYFSKPLPPTELPMIMTKLYNQEEKYEN